MARYRKIDVRIWNDKKFRTLSDNGKLAFILILTHPDTTPLGMLRSRPMALAMELGWQPDAMSDAIKEVSSMGMIKLDERAGLIFVPNFLKYNPPNGPNALKSWPDLLDLMPECSLRDEALKTVNAFIGGLSKGMRDAIPNAFMDAIEDAIKDANETSCDIQEQDTGTEYKEKYKKENLRQESNQTSKPKRCKTQTISKPEDVSQQIWDDFLTIRKAKKSPLTETALNQIRIEAEKAGLKLDAALATSCARGWQGFEADWVNNGKNQTTSSDPSMNSFLRPSGEA